MTDDDLESALMDITGVGDATAQKIIDVLEGYEAASDVGNGSPSVHYAAVEDALDALHDERRAEGSRIAYAKERLEDALYEP